MTELINITHPFLSIEDFHRRVGRKLARLIHRLAGKYPQLQKGCGTKRMLLALSVAWGLSDFAQAGNTAAFEHIDEALSPIACCGYQNAPSCGCVMVSGEPYFLSESESLLRFLWDGFAIFIDCQGIDAVTQHFFDVADVRQSKAYTVIQEDFQEEDTPLAQIDNSVDLEQSDESNEREQLYKGSEREQPYKGNELEQPYKGNELEQLNEQDGLMELTMTAIRIGDIEDIKHLEHLIGLMVDNKVADRCREMLIHHRMEHNRLMERNLLTERPHEYHFEGDVAQFIARGHGFVCEDRSKTK